MLHAWQERTGGEQTTRAMFRHLTSRDPDGSFDHVVQAEKEVLNRAASKSGEPKIEIVDHTQKPWRNLFQLR